MHKFLEALIQFKTWWCLSFTGCILIYTVCSLFLGQRTMEFVMVFELIGLSAGATLLQFVCFSGRVIKKMRYSLRMVIFAVPMLGLVSLCAVVFHWFPISDGIAWMIFTIAYLLGFLGLTLGFEIYFRITGKKYDGLLGQYQAGRKKDGRA